MKSILKFSRKLVLEFNSFVKMSNNTTEVLRKDALNIFNAAIDSVLPDTMIHSILQKHEQQLNISNKCFSLKSSKVTVVGFGKAVIGMARAIQDILGDDIKIGFLNVPIGTIETLQTSGKMNLIPRSDGRIKINEGAANNLPDENAEKGAKEIFHMVDCLKENDILIILISGGGSALLPAPIHPITLQEKCDVTKLLANRGATIIELNTVRKRLSYLKGGKLALEAKPAKVISFILSDVIGNPVDQIASGPTTENGDDPPSAMNIIEKYDLVDQMPESILEVLQKPPLQTPLSNFDHVSNFIIGSNEIALRASEVLATNLGYHVIVLSKSVCGEAKLFGQFIARLASAMVGWPHSPVTNNALVQELQTMCPAHGIEPTKISELMALTGRHGKIAVVSGGETSVKVAGQGSGGRNQECVLACGLEWANCGKEVSSNTRRGDFMFLSAGSDGIDGPTSAAGAVAYRDQFVGLDCSPHSFLIDNDSNTFYERYRANDLIKTGITGTNVMDFHILLISQSELITF